MHTVTSATRGILRRGVGWRRLRFRRIRVMLSEQADIGEGFRGPGNFKPTDNSWPTLCPNFAFGAMPCRGARVVVVGY